MPNIQQQTSDDRFLVIALKQDDKQAFTRLFHIYYKDLEIDSPYNTYGYKGLPPGPISNPGEESITASLTPSKTNYLYFVLGNNGKHHFSKKS